MPTLDQRGHRRFLTLQVAGSYIRKQHIEAAMILRNTAAALLTIVTGCTKQSQPASPESAMPLVTSAANSTRLYRISVEGKWGFIDTSGAVVIQPQFNSAAGFSEGLAAVTVEGLTEEDRLFERTASGFIDERGKFVIGPGPPPNFKFPEYRNDYSYGDFHDGRAKFWVGDATGFGGFIDRTGRVAIPPKYPSVSDFAQGLACVSLPRPDGSPFGPKKTGFIDGNGRFVIPAQRSFVALGFSEGLCVIDLQDAEGDWQAAVIDLRGNVVIPAGAYTGISDFIGGLSRVVKNGKVGCINARGEIVIPIEFEQLWEFEQNDLSVGKKDGSNFLVDRTGRCVKEIAPGHDFDVGRLRNGMATAMAEGKFGYVNAEGSLIIPPRFDRGEEFRGELALVQLGNIHGYIDRRGDFVWQTDRWEEPIRNAVKPPLSGFLAPDTIESLPLDYNQQGVENAIVFASRTPVEALRQWFKKTFGSRLKLLDDDNESDRINISFFSEELSGSLHAIDSSSDEADGFIDFYASANMRQLKESHQPAAIGILILDR